MADMTLQEQLAFIKQQTIRMNAYNYASSLIGWDSATGDTPKAGLDKKSQYSGTLAGERYRILTSPEFKSSVLSAASQMETIPNDQEKAMVREWKKSIERMEKIPEDVYTAYIELISKTEILWEDAKENNDFEGFVPYYQEIFDYQKKFAEYYGYEDHPYNALLEDFEPGMTVKQLDLFFGELRAEIVPLLKTITAVKNKKTESFDFLSRQVPADQQEKFSRRLCDIIGFDLKRGMLATSEHPFTNTLCQNDVRITSNYDETNFTSAIFSTTHEGGHGIYEQCQSPELEDMGLSGGASSAIHESQSRMYENVFGRSMEFWKCYYAEMQETFNGVIDDVNIEHFHKAINQVTPSLIRVEADELTYALHVMVRYEIEKGLMEGSIQPSELSQIWKEKMKDYLGIEPPTDTLGVLQDVHWSCGLVGYFPSYALGNAYAAQLLHYMLKEVDVFGNLEKGDFSKIHAWLNEKVHRHGQVYLPDDLIVRATGEAFNPKYYVTYLKEKYKDIYQL